jgi:phospholipid/cholesterol/gamma-HCH transport system substrate-binding protein
MKGQQTNKIKLGIFVLSAVALLLLGLFYIGNNKNIFHSNINVSANFKNVGGLMTGNNVRFNGINVGTISKVYAIADTLIKVEFTIDEVSMKSYYWTFLKKARKTGYLSLTKNPKIHVFLALPQIYKTV